GMAETSAGSMAGVSRGWRRGGRRSNQWRMGAYAPAGGCVSTAADMARLAQALLEGTAPGTLAPGALGGRLPLFRVTDSSDRPGKRLVWHNGETGGYSAFCAVLPEAGLFAMALTNRADAADLGRLVRAVLRQTVPASSIDDRRE